MPLNLAANLREAVLGFAPRERSQIGRDARVPQRLHDVEETEHSKAAKLEQAAVGPTFAVSGAWVLLPKGIAGARVQPVAKSLNKLGR